MNGSPLPNGAPRHPHGEAPRRGASPDPATTAPSDPTTTATPPDPIAPTDPPAPRTDPPAPHTPRVTPGGRSDIGLPLWALIHGGSRLAGTGPPNLFLTLARNRGLFRGWLWFAGRLMPRGRLPRRTTELVILRVAHRRSCRYEFEHHVRIGRRAGIGAADLERVTDGTGWDGLAPAERAALEAADSLLDHRDIDDTLWSAVRAHFDEALCVELCLLVGHYDMLATTIRALRVAPDGARRTARRKT